MTYHEGWQKQWRSPEPKREYDVVIVGAGGHGLATAYYLAKEHGLRNIAVVERGWLGGGNTARNTTIVRSNYLWDEATQLYEKSISDAQLRHSLQVLKASGSRLQKYVLASFK